jgi:hypothetical protein
VPVGPAGGDGVHRLGAVRAPALRRRSEGAAGRRRRDPGGAIAHLAQHIAGGERAAAAARNRQQVRLNPFAPLAQGRLPSPFAEEYVML